MDCFPVGERGLLQGGSVARASPNINYHPLRPRTRSRLKIYRTDPTMIVMPVHLTLSGKLPNSRSQ